MCIAAVVQLQSNELIQSPSICFVIPYFGKWPVWMSYFLASCNTNETINWLFYTDCGDLENCPKNVEVKQIAFDDYCHKVSTALGIKFKPKSAYKLCDIKPALGFIHADELKEFDFWAFGDVDLIYGNLRQYFTDQRLQKKDLYTTHATRVAGHLSLVRNTEEMRRAFMRVKGWQSMLSSQEHIAFDEKAFSKLFLRHKNSPILARIAKIFNPWLRKAELVEAYSTPYGRIKWLDGSDCFPKVWHWRQGELTNDMNGHRTFPYFHFLFWKKQAKLLDHCEPLGKDDQGLVFNVSEDGFYTDSIETKN